MNISFGDFEEIISIPLTCRQKEKKFIEALSESTENLDYTEHGGGFVNFHNTCWLNSSLQCVLRALSPVLSKVLALEDGEFGIWSSLAFLNSSHLSSTSPIIPSNHIGALVREFCDLGEMQDCHEFLLFLLDQLREEELEIRKRLEENEEENEENKEEEERDDDGGWMEVGSQGRVLEVNHHSTTSSQQISFISSVFEGVMRVPSNKSKRRINSEPFLSLSLPFQSTKSHSLQDMIDTFCNPIKEEGKREKEIKFSTLPPNLIIHLSRFSFSSSSSKIHTQISFPLSLSLADSLYTLSSIIFHSGESLHSGHYTSAVRRSEDGAEWTLFDDIQVQSLPFTNIQEVMKSEVYLLFFSKVS